MNRGEAEGSGAIDTRRTPVYHIVEVPGEIERTGEMTPTDSYYEQLHGHLRKKYPKADPHLLDHLIALEAFLDKSIVFGFSYGLSKAEIAVMQVPIRSRVQSFRKAAWDQRIRMGARL